MTFLSFGGRPCGAEESVEVKISWSAGKGFASDRQHFFNIIVILLRQRSSPQEGEKSVFGGGQKIKKNSLSLSKPPSL